MALTRYRSVVADSGRWEGFEFRDGDIIICTPPKSGTTWTQMLVALLVFGTPDLPQPLAEISPWMDMQLYSRDDIFARLAAQDHRRFIKTHTPLDGVPDDERVTYICVGRDPRDVAVSCAHHMSNINLERFLEVRQRAVGLDDLAELGLVLPQPGEAPPPPPTPPGPFSDYLESDYQSDNVNVMTLSYVLHHLQMAWERRDDPRVALFHYSDLQADLPGQLRRLAGALDVPLSESKAAELAAAASFAAMRENAEMVAPNSDVQIWQSTTEFFHKGSNGQWQDAFDEAVLRRYDERCAQLAAPDLLTWAHEGWLGSVSMTG